MVISTHLGYLGCQIHAGSYFLKKTKHDGKEYLFSKHFTVPWQFLGCFRHLVDCSGHSDSKEMVRQSLLSVQKLFT